MTRSWMVLLTAAMLLSSAGVKAKSLFLFDYTAAPLGPLTKSSGVFSYDPRIALEVKPPLAGHFAKHFLTITATDKAIPFATVDFSGVSVPTKAWRQVLLIWSGEIAATTSEVQFSLNYGHFAGLCRLIARGKQLLVTAPGSDGKSKEQVIGSYQPDLFASIFILLDLKTAKCRASMLQANELVKSPLVAIEKQPAPLPNDLDLSLDIWFPHPEGNPAVRMDKVGLSANFTN